MNLYKLANKWLSIVELSDQFDEETFRDTLESIEEPIQEKLINIVKVIRSIENEIESIDKEIKRLQDFKQNKNNSIKRLKEMLQDGVELIGEETKTGGKKVTLDNPFVKSVTLKNNPPSVKSVEVDMLPERYLIPQTPKVDNKGLIEAWKAGDKIPGVVIEQGKGVLIR